MNADRTTKLLLALIALGLCLNLARSGLGPQPVEAAAPQADLPAMEVALRNMEPDVEEIRRNFDRMVTVVERFERTTAALLQAQRETPSCQWRVIDTGGDPLGETGATPPVMQSLRGSEWMLKAVYGDELIFEACR